MKRSAILLAVAGLAGCGGGASTATEPAVPPGPQPQVEVGRATPGRTLAALAAAGERGERIVPPALSALAGGRVVLDERVGNGYAVAALARGDRAYAAAMRFANGRWHLVLGNHVRLHPVRPDPGERVRARTQIAAGVVAESAILQAGVWFDGRALPTRTGGFDLRHLTMWQEAPQPLRPGRHVVVAYAGTAADAAALAWTFVVR